MHKYTFKKNERLASKKSISELFTKGKKIKNFPFFVRFLVIEDSDSPAKLLISVPKKIFKLAYKRNRIKRLIREAYRLNKHMLYDCLETNNTKILLSLSYYNSKTPDYNLVLKKVIEIFSTLCDKINNNENNIS
ncbi:MAG: ribonuclease P protein component [Bacteroidota bacterium]|nr:ribonuclease P protein component [Bacteroidota bacterium]